MAESISRRMRAMFALISRSSGKSLSCPPLSKTRPMRAAGWDRSGMDWAYSARRGRGSWLAADLRAVAVLMVMAQKVARVWSSCWVSTELATDRTSATGATGSQPARGRVRAELR